MRFTFKKIIAAAVMAAAVFSNCVSAPLTVMASSASSSSSDQTSESISWPKGPSVGSKSAVLMDVDSGTILYSKKPNVQHYPASITKVMTALLALENSSLDDTVTYSKEAVAQSYGGTSSISRDVGEKMTMEESLYGMMLESANECAWAIAEHVGGTEKNFVKMMNEKAKELGCTNTHFDNPNGLPDKKHVTTALDMAKIARAAYQNPVFAKIVGTKTYVIPPTNKHKESTYLNNHHCMLNYYHTSRYLYDYCVGGKTGYTVAAKSTLVTYAKKDGKTLVCVVMCAQSPDHWNDTRKLFEWGFKNFKSVKVSEVTNLSQQADKLGSTNYGIDSSLISVDDSSTLMIPKNADESDITMSLSKSTSSDSSVIGQMNFKYGSKSVGSCQLLADSSEETTYPFHNLSADEGGSKASFIQINLVLIIVVTAAALAAAIVIFLLLRNLFWSVSKHKRDRNSEKKGRISYKKIRNNGRH
ncbi:MAG: D-alanyl-D-alanine carboxypeptidase family protein [Candidatus Weimeria sp.]